MHACARARLRSRVMMTVKMLTMAESGRKPRDRSKCDSACSCLFSLIACAKVVRHRLVLFTFV
jgi:hypothetical protein